MKTKLFTLLFALMASVGTLFAQSGTCGQNLTWNLVDSVLTISGTGDMTNWSASVSVPWYNYLDNIAYLSLPDGLTSIGQLAFCLCKALTSVTIPNTVTSIGRSAFDQCSGLASVTIPNSVTSIGDGAFYLCKGLTSPIYTSKIFAFLPYSYSGSYSIPDGIESIVGGAFEYRSSLTSVSIPNSVTNIGQRAFAECSRLLSIDVASDNPNYCSVDGVLFNKDKTIIIQFPGGKQGAYTIPNSVKRVEDFAFGDCYFLSSVEIPNSVTSIGNAGFRACNSLSSLTIGNSVTSIGDYAFIHCRQLTSVTNYAIVPQTINSTVFYNVDLSAITLYVPAESLEAYQNADVWKDFGTIKAIEEEPAPCIIDSGTYRKTITWELSCDSVLTIGGTGAMSQFVTIPWASLSGSVKSVVVRDGVTSIYGFRNYPNLTSVTLGDSVTQITNYAFKNCTALTSIEIPNSVTKIGQHAFDSCLSLVSIEIPSSVTSIGQHAFDSCYALTSVTINSNEVTSHSNLKTIFGDQVTTYIIGDDVTSILNGAFYECTNLSSVSIGNGVTSIGDYAFLYCSNLTSVSLGNSVASIGYAAFYNCTNLSSINLPNSVTSIGQNAFVNCYAITSIEIPNSVTSIGGAAFAGCTGLYSIDVAKDNPNYCSVDGVLFTKDKTILLQYPAGKTDKSYSIPNSVSGFGAYVFYGCSALTSVEIPNSVTSIEEAAFAGSIGLNSIDVATDNPNYCSIDGVLFTKDLTILLHYPRSKTDKSYSVPDGVTRIGRQAFGLCSVTSIEIPNSVTTIGAWTFEGCTALSTITCRAVNPPALEEYSFGYMDLSAITLYVPAESIEAYRTADVWKEFGTILSIQAEEVTETITEVGTEPQDNGVIVTWPVSSEAVTYTLEIRKNGELICTLSFNAQGQLIGIAFAPDRNGNHHAPAALMTSNGGLRFTVTGLESGTNYHLDVQAKDAEDKAIVSYSVEFKTTGQAPIITDIDHVPGGQAYSTKVLRDGQVFILRGDKTYTLQGQEVK